LRFMGIETSLARRHRSIFGKWKAQKNLQMDDAVHCAPGALQGSLRRIHGSGNVLLKRVRHENMVVPRIAVVGPGSGEVVDSVMDVVATSRPIRSGTGGLGRWRLLRGKNSCAGYGGQDRSAFVEIPSSGDLHQHKISFTQVS